MQITEIMHHAKTYYELKSKANETEHISKSVLTNSNAYETPTGFYGPENEVEFLNHLSMQILLIIKSEFPPELTLWQSKKQQFFNLKNLQL